VGHPKIKHAKRVAAGQHFPQFHTVNCQHGNNWDLAMPCRCIWKFGMIRAWYFTQVYKKPRLWELKVFVMFTKCPPHDSLFSHTTWFHSFVNWLSKVLYRSLFFSYSENFQPTYFRYFRFPRWVSSKINTYIISFLGSKPRLDIENCCCLWIRAP